MDNSCNSSSSGTLNIDCDSLIGHLQVNLQHLSDLVLFSSVASSSVQEKDYIDPPAFFKFQIANSQKYDFSQVKERFQQWCLINSFEDAVDYLNCFLDECYVVCEILKSSQNNLIKFGLFRHISSRGKVKFNKLGLPDKIKRLKDAYGVFSPMEDHIMSLNRVRKCLVHRLGIVGSQDVSPNNVITAKFKQIQLLAVNQDNTQEIVISGPLTVESGWRVAVRLNDFNKDFRLSERIVFSEHEHVWAIFTFFWFGQEIKNAICKSFKLLK
jgi:hypothetical protein